MSDKIDFHLDAWPTLMRLDMAAAYLGCSTRIIDRLQAEGHLIPTKTHFGKRFRRSELDAYVASLPEWEDPKKN